MRANYESHARLARSVDIQVTGGEGYRGTRNFREALAGRAYDVRASRMPSLRAASSYAAKSPSSLNLFTFPASCIGSMGLRAAGFFQASAAIGSEWQELVFVTPPLLPEDLLSPGLQVLKTKTMYKFENGEVHLPDFQD